MINKYIKRFPHALRGLLYAARVDFGFRTQLYGIGALVTLYLYLVQPLSVVEILFVILAYGLILITELQNSALEIALDHIHPEHHPAIGRSKDLAAAAVFIAGLFLIIVLITIAL